MSSVRITGIRKDNGNHYNKHEGITHYRWINANGKTDVASRVDMVTFVLQGNMAYVQNGQNIAYCDVRTSASGNKFLQTKSDNTYTDNLLELPEC